MSTKEAEITAQDIDTFADRYIAWLSRLGPKDRLMATWLVNAASEAGNHADVTGHVFVAPGAGNAVATAAIVSALQQIVNKTPTSTPSSGSSSGTRTK